MADDRKPETLSADELEKVQGGITLDNGLKFTGKGRDSGDVIATGNQTPGADGDSIHGMETGFGVKE